MIVRHHARRLVGALALLATLPGCSSDVVTPAEPLRDPGALYWSLTLNQQGINLSTVAPYDTFRLVATPRTRDGTPIEGLPAPRFFSADSIRVAVGPDGVVRGLRAGRIRVTVTLTDPIRNVTHADTAFVNVTTAATPPVLARLSLEPNPADSAKGALIGAPYYRPAAIVPRAFDQADAPIANLTVWIESSDPLTATYNNQTRALTVRRPGPVTFYASTVAYGVERADTLDFTVGIPLVASAFVRAQTDLGGSTTYRFDPMVTTVATGGYVVWTRQGAVPAYDVSFDDPANVAEDLVRPLPFPMCIGSTPAGNIAPFDTIPGAGGLGLCTRHFPVPGTYTWRSDALGATGTIVVVDESEQ